MILGRWGRGLSSWSLSSGAELSPRSSSQTWTTTLGVVGVAVWSSYLSPGNRTEKKRLSETCGTVRASQLCHSVKHSTWSELWDGTQQVVVHHGHGVLRLLPADGGGGRGGDQELLIGLGRLQPRTPDVDRLQDERDRLEFGSQFSNKQKLNSMLFRDVTWAK